MFCQRLGVHRDPDPDAGPAPDPDPDPNVWIQLKVGRFRCLLKRDRDWESAGEAIVDVDVEVAV